MKACIDAVIGSDVYREGREKVRATVWQNVGGAAAAVVDYMTAGNGTDEAPEETASEGSGSAQGSDPVGVSGSAQGSGSAGVSDNGEEARS